MRTIKFRAWDKMTSQMIKWEDILDHWNFKAFKQPYHVFMQYTGLKDAYGKEIYEGDIVEHIRHGKGVVEWNRNNACFFVKANIEYIFDNNAGEYIHREVIGNIYENPELLKAGVAIGNQEVGQLA